jgi:hypothetical protein
MDEWRERVGADRAKEAPRATIATAVKFVERAKLDGIAQPDLAKALVGEGVSRSTAYDIIKKAESKKAITRRKTDDRYVVPVPPHS